HGDTPHRAPGWRRAGIDHRGDLTQHNRVDPHGEGEKWTLPARFDNLGVDRQRDRQHQVAGRAVLVTHAAYAPSLRSLGDDDHTGVVDRTADRSGAIGPEQVDTLDPS